MRLRAVFILLLLPALAALGNGGGRGAGAGNGNGNGGAGNAGGSGTDNSGGAGNNAGGNGNGNANGLAHPHGNKVGNYQLTIAGDFTGVGVAKVSETSISISGSLKTPGGGTKPLNFANIPLVNNHFMAKRMVAGVTLVISGRVDLPAATDTEENDHQASTGRVSASIKDNSGNMARLVAVQDNP